MKSIYKIIDEQRNSGVNTALCTIVSTKGSTPLKEGAKMLVTETGVIFGTIGGGNLEKKTIENALLCIAGNSSSLFEHNLLSQHGMCCGGTVKIFIEPIMKPNKLFIFGAGHVGRALSQFASDLDFEIYVIDERPQEMEKIIDPSVNKALFNYSEILPLLPFDENTYVTILTYDHQIDREILAYCIKKPFAYLGMIGSKRKVEISKKMFLSTNLFTEEELKKVDMPMGMNILANQPHEIAISILAKLIEVKNQSILQKQTKAPLETVLDHETPITKN